MSTATFASLSAETNHSTKVVSPIAESLGESQHCIKSNHGFPLPGASGAEQTESLHHHDSVQ